MLVYWRGSDIFSESRYFKENKSLRHNHLLDLGPGFQIESRFPVGPGLQRNNL